MEHSVAYLHSRFRKLLSLHISRHILLHTHTNIINLKEHYNLLLNAYTSYIVSQDERKNLQACKRPRGLLATPDST